MNMMRLQAKRAMNTRGQKSCLVIDHLVEALGSDPSSTLKRALILNYIDENPNVTQTEVMNHIGSSKSAMNRETDWLFNHGCILRQNAEKDGRAITLQTCGYSKKALESALDYFPEGHKGLQSFLNRYINILKQDRPTLRDARIVSTLYDKGEAPKSKVMEELYNGSATTNNRAYKKLIEDGVIEDG